MRFRIRFYRATESHVSIGVDQILTDKMRVGYFGHWNVEDQSSLVKAVLWVKGVAAVWINPYEVVIEKAIAFTWDEVLLSVLRVIHIHLDIDAEMIEVGPPLYYNVNSHDGKISEWEGTEHHELRIFPPLVSFHQK